MTETEKILLVGGLAFIAWYAFTRPVAVAAPTASVPPPYNPYGSLAGYAPMPNYPREPGDTNNYIPAITAGLNFASSLTSAITKSSGSTTSTGSYSSVPDGWSTDMPADW